MFNHYLSWFSGLPSEMEKPCHANDLIDFIGGVDKSFDVSILAVKLSYSLHDIFVESETICK